LVRSTASPPAITRTLARTPPSTIVVVIVALGAVAAGFGTSALFGGRWNRSA
jgi:hypothetical protein